jgi:hypothetical protein
MKTQRAVRGNWNGSALCLVVMAASVVSHAAGAHAAACTRIELKGEVNAGQEWKAAFGQGWVFRLVPVQPGKEGYSGWDLVVDRDPSAGYPDALLLATPPYNSISEREVATTFGLRAQDVLGWNPRSFRFLTDPAAFQQARRLYTAIGPSAKEAVTGPQAPTLQQLMTINQHSSAGEFRILDARIAPGTADPAPFARKWALQSSRTPHTTDAPLSPTSRGAFQSIGFSITLWLPSTWRAPKDLHPTPAPCSQ